MNNIKDSNITQISKKEDNSALYLGAGLGLGTYAAATTLLIGTACPVCIIAAPVLIGAGLYQRITKSKLTKK